MKKYFLTLFVFLILIHNAYGQSVYQDVVYLKNGDIVKGLIVENVPNDYVKVEISNDSKITIKYIDILKFTKELLSEQSPNKVKSVIESTSVTPKFNKPKLVKPKKDYTLRNVVDIAALGALVGSIANNNNDSKYIWGGACITLGLISLAL